jgi:hypothetical protein
MFNEKLVKIGSFHVPTYSNASLTVFNIICCDGKKNNKYKVCVKVVVKVNR